MPKTKKRVAAKASKKSGGSLAATIRAELAKPVIPGESCSPPVTSKRSKSRNQGRHGQEHGRPPDSSRIALPFFRSEPGPPL